MSNCKIEAVTFISSPTQTESKSLSESRDTIGLSDNVKLAEVVLEHTMDWGLTKISIVLLPIEASEEFTV